MKFLGEGLMMKYIYQGIIIMFMGIICLSLSVYYLKGTALFRFGVLGFALIFLGLYWVVRYTRVKV